MKKNYLWGICAVMALSSCSQDDVVSVPQTGISYSVVTDKASRAENVFCNNNLPASFNVSAFYNAENSDKESKSGQYFNGDKVNISGTTVTPEQNRYWPEKGTLDFYAYVNAGTTYKFRNSEDENKTQFVDFQVKKTVSEQVDLLYAVAKGQSKSTNSKVTLNFRHALSQIVFQARNENPAIHVIVKGVGVGNVMSKNTFTFPETTTKENIINHDQNDNIATISNQGTWGTAKDPDAYNVTFDPVISLVYPTSETSTTTNLTNNVLYGNNETETETPSDVFKNAMLLMPQTLNDPWNPDATTPSTDDGSYLELDCKIFNVAGDSYDAKTDVKLHDGKIRMPLGSAKETVEWKQGFKYVYTFVFKKSGNGGYDPDEGDPVLVPIEYTITVDDFTNETNNDVEMNVPQSNN